MIFDEKFESLLESSDEWECRECVEGRIDHPIMKMLEKWPSSEKFISKINT